MGIGLYSFRGPGARGVDGSSRPRSPRTARADSGSGEDPPERPQGALRHTVRTPKAPAHELLAYIDVFGPETFAVHALNTPSRFGAVEHPIDRKALAEGISEPVSSPARREGGDVRSPLGPPGGTKLADPDRPPWGPRGGVPVRPPGHSEGPRRRSAFPMPGRGPLPIMAIGRRGSRLRPSGDGVACSRIEMWVQWGWGR